MSHRVLLVVLGVVSFLAAAKSHGRQLRLERELAGIWEVTFTGQNPALVEALWRRERLVFWGTVIVLAAVMLIVRAVWAAFPRGAAMALVAHVGVPLISAFVVTGLASVIRFGLALRLPAEVPRAPEWVSAAVWGSIGWWVLTLLLCVLLATLARAVAFASVVLSEERG